MKEINRPLSLLVTVFCMIILPLVIAPSSVSADEPIKEVSYLPRDYDWGRFWFDYRAGVRTQLDQDLNIIQSLGANTVRIGIEPHVAGYLQPAPNFLPDFKDMLSLIAAHGLKAHIVLFNFDDFYPHAPPGQPELPDFQMPTVINRSAIWLQTLFANLDPSDTQRVAVWELHNEILLYCSDAIEYCQVNQIPPGTRIDRAHQWIQTLFPILKTLAGTTPCTVSVSNVEWLDNNGIGALSPDIYNLHWYPSWTTWTSPLPGILDRAYQIIGSDKRLMIGEFGCNTYDFSETSQENAYRDILYEVNQKGIVDMGVWILNDFPLGRKRFVRSLDGYGGYLPDQYLDLPSSELHYGVYKIGTGNLLQPKSAVTLLQSAFQGNLPQSPSPSILRNTSFETINPYSGTLENWLPWNEDYSPTSWYTRDDIQAHMGSYSVKVTPGKTNFIVGLAQTPTLKVLSNRSYALTGYVKTSADGIARLGLTWLNEAGGYLSDTDTPPLGNAVNWTLLQMSGSVPNNASHVIVSAKMIDPVGGAVASVWFDDMSFVVSNQSPVLNAIGNPSIYAGNTLSFQIGATDPDANDSLTYSASNLPSGATFDPATRTFRWTPSTSQIGTYPVTFTVSDALGATDSETITITVSSRPSYGGGRRSCTCFLANTPILLADGSFRPIEKLKVGDWVLAFDEKTKTLKKDKVKEFFEHETEEYLIVNGHLRVTANHPVYSEGKWTEIGKLKVGDALLDHKGNPYPITSIQKVKEHVKVYNLEVNPYHTYIAGGVVVHNKAKPICEDL